MKAPTILLILAVLLAGCSAIAPADTPTPLPTETPIPPTATPEPTATFTPEPTATETPEPTATLTPTEAPCSHVDLNGRYVDFRTYRNAIYGWIMISEQTGCEIHATETFFLKASGPGSEGYAEEITGTIDGDRVRVCYVRTGYCLNLVIFDGGDLLANGLEGWHYEKSVE